MHAGLLLKYGIPVISCLNVYASLLNHNVNFPLFFYSQHLFHSFTHSFYASGQMVPSDVVDDGATSLCRIDVNMTSFLCHVPAGIYHLHDYSSLNIMEIR